MNTNLIRFLTLSFIICMLTPLGARDVKSIEEWTFSSLKGNNTYFAAYKNPKDKTPITEEQRAALRRAMIDKSSNSNIPLLAEPAIMEDSISNPSKVTVGLFDESRDEPESPKGVASVKYDDPMGGGDDQYIVWRTTFLDTYVLISDKVTCIYTVHRNVKHPDGGYLLTYVTIRNSPLGVSSYSMSGSAKRVK